MIVNLDSSSAAGKIVGFFHLLRYRGVCEEYLAEVLLHVQVGVGLIEVISVDSVYSFQVLFSW